MTHRVDLVMWAKNGESYLPEVLSRIDQVISHEEICHKILVDDHSTDRTVEIAEDFNWAVYTNPQGGIPSGANEALRHVDRDFFVSIEQDIILSRKWWDKIPKYMKDPFVACAQGIRVPTQPVLRLLDEWQYGDPKTRSSLVSMDNNIFRTKVVRSMGGFPRICPVCTDTVLMRRIQSETPYRWVIDPDVVSLHIRDDLKATVEHQYKLSYLCARTPYCSATEKHDLAVMFRIFLTSPIRALEIAIKTGCPNIVWAYPLIRLYQLNVDLTWRSQVGASTLKRASK